MKFLRTILTQELFCIARKQKTARTSGSLSPFPDRGVSLVQTNFEFHKRSANAKARSNSKKITDTWGFVSVYISMPQTLIVAVARARVMRSAAISGDVFLENPSLKIKTKDKG